MKKNQLTIDLGKINLTPSQRKALHTAIHDTVANNMNDIAVTAATLKAGIAVSSRPPTKAKSVAANLMITFTNTEPGLSSLTATSKGESKTISQSGSIRFQKVETGDTIMVNGSSLGNTTITIDIDADPTQMNFDPGMFNGSFFIN